MLGRGDYWFWDFMAMDRGLQEKPSVRGRVAIGIVKSSLNLERKMVNHRTNGNEEVVEFELFIVRVKSSPFRNPCFS